MTCLPSRFLRDLDNFHHWVEEANYLVLVYGRDLLGCSVALTGDLFRVYPDSTSIVALREICLGFNCTLEFTAVSSDSAGCHP
jgi:hypothetical protein